MILPEDRPESPSKLPNATEQQQQQQPQPAPPSYEAASSSRLVDPEAQPIYAPVFVKRGEPAGKRFCQAFCVAIIIYFLLGALTSSIVEVGRFRDWPLERDWEDTARPRPEDGKVLNCKKGSHGWTSPYTTTFELDSTSDVLYFYTRGKQLGGNVVITQDETEEETNVVKVDVTALHSTYRFLHAVSVCSLERKSGEQGVAIFSPTKWKSYLPRLPELEFEVTIRLPKRGREVLQIARLETDADNFSHHVGDLAERVLFRSIQLKGSNQHIFSNHLKAVEASVVTSNSRIVGNYEATKSLTLQTSNDRINATATLVQVDPDDKEGAKLRMKTSNAKIESSINLVSQLPEMDYGGGGQYTVDVVTSNSRIAVDFPDAAINSRLFFTAKTSNANAFVKLHPTFEGQFEVKTSNQVAQVFYQPVSDPTGEHRPRSVNIMRKGSFANGQAIWQGQYMGSAKIQTSNAAAQLYL